MSEIARSDELSPSRRRFCGTAAMTLAAAQLGILSSADASPSEAEVAAVPPAKPGTSTSLGPIKQIEAASAKAEAMADQNPIYISDVQYYASALASAERCYKSLTPVATVSR